MQGQMEVEEILEQQLWAARNHTAVDDFRTVYMPPAEMLRERELRTYRDCPLEYADEPTRFWNDGWGLACVLVVVGMVIAAFLGLTHR